MTRYKQVSTSGVGSIVSCVTLIPLKRLIVFYVSSYLVDPASSHMLFSKIKPCMSKYRPSQGEIAKRSLNQPLFMGSVPTLTWITTVME